MTPPNRLDRPDQELVGRFEDAGQGHVFRFLPELSRAETEELLADARSIDPREVRQLMESRPPVHDVGAMEPPGAELIRLSDGDDYRRLRNAAHDRGIAEMREGRVAVVIAAGGQGTRLGSVAPKAMWPVGPLSGKTLLQWHFEKVLFWARQIGRAVPIVVLVSDATAKATDDYLRWNNWFGVDPTWVRLPKQRSLPSVDDSGKILLASKSRIALAPNGHGGTFAALRDSKLLDLFADHGVRTLSYVQIDNPLVRTLDPIFVGFHARRESEFSSKSVMKRSPQEKVGVFAQVGGRPAIVEYSELTDEQANAADDDGTLTYGQGNIAAHCIDLEFARRIADVGLPYHRARKKVVHVDDAGRTVSPSEPNATKFETFLFDALPLTQRSLIVETLRSDEFSPIKNGSGDDTPDSARRDLIELFRAWHHRAGRPVPTGSVEVSPLEAPDEHAFRRKLGLAWV